MTKHQQSIEKLNSKGISQPLLTFDAHAYRKQRIHHLEKIELIAKKYALKHPKLLKVIKRLYIRRAKFLKEIGMLHTNWAFYPELKRFERKSVSAQSFENKLGRRALNLYAKAYVNKIWQNSSWRASSRVWRHPVTISMSKFQIFKAKLNAKCHPNDFSKEYQQVKNALKYSKMTACIHAWSDSSKTTKQHPAINVINAAKTMVKRPEK